MILNKFIFTEVNNYHNLMQKKINSRGNSKIEYKHKGYKVNNVNVNCNSKISSI